MVKENREKAAAAKAEKEAAAKAEAEREERKAQAQAAFDLAKSALDESLAMGETTKRAYAAQLKKAEKALNDALAAA